MHGGDVDVTAWTQETDSDDQRRFEYCRRIIEGKRLLDFGCGNGGFLLRARGVARSVMGLDQEPHFRARDIPLVRRLDETEETFDVITMFHVLEHLPDPRASLSQLSSRLAQSGEILIEVPNASDALLRLYGCRAFKDFTYWSCHLFSFTAETLTRLVRQAGGVPQYVKHIQRYPLSNHLYWLAVGKPGGHREWTFLDAPVLTEQYEARLAAKGLTDTLFASVRFPEGSLRS